MHTTIPPRATRLEWTGLAVLALPTLLVSMDMTVMYLAVPALSAALKPGSSQLLWITDIYAFLEAGMLITMGTLGDRIGRRRLLLIGAVAFAVASTVAAFSVSAGMLIAARALLGVTGATLLPSTLSLIRNMFHDERQRTMAVGLWTTCFSTGTMLGPLIGGFLLNHFWWGSVFLMGVPVMLLLLVLAPALLPEFRDPGAGWFDLAGAGLLIAAVLSVIFGVKRMAEHGTGWLPVLSVVAGLAIGAAFIRRQQRQADPLIDLSLFRLPAFNVAMVTFFFCLFSWGGMFLYITQYLQLVLDMRPYNAGLWTMPGAAGSIAGCILAPVMVRHARRVVVVTCSLLLFSAGLFLLAQVHPPQGLALLIMASVLVSIGCGTTVTLINDMMLSIAPPARAGAAAGISETCATFGSAFGVAILGSIGTAIYRKHMAAAVTDGIPSAVAEAARSTLGGALAVTKQLPAQTGRQLLDTARAAFEQSFRTAAGISCVLILASAVMAAAVLRRVNN